MFSRRTILARDWRYYRRHLIWLLLAGTLTAAMLAGALLTGDALAATLTRKVHLSLGRGQTILRSDGRFLPAAFLDELPRQDGPPPAGVLHLPAAASQGDYACTVQLYGIDQPFFHYAPEPDAGAPPPPGSVWLNEAAAQRLRLQPGAGITLQLQPSARPDDLFTAYNRRAVLFCQVAGILPPDRFGWFGLRNSQEPEAAVFIDREYLAGRLQLPGSLNLVLSALPLSQLIPGNFSPLALDYTLSAGTILKNHGYYLAPAAERRLAAGPGHATLGYLINAFLAADGRSSHYGFALGSPDHGLQDDEAIVSTVVASRLQLQPGDMVQVRYFAPDMALYPAEQTAAFRIKAVQPPEALLPLREQMPDLPGLTDKLDCSEWEGKAELDLSLVTAADEAYWDMFGPTPKIVVSLPAARKLWGSRFGSATAWVLPADRDSLPRLNLEEAGIAAFEPRQRYLADAAHGVDFGALFIGLSFFVMAGGLILQTGMQRLFWSLRRNDRKILHDCGWSPAACRRLLLTELLAIGVMAAGLGALLLGPLLHLLLRLALQTVWRGVSGETALVWTLPARTLALAWAIGILANLGCLLFPEPSPRDQSAPPVRRRWLLVLVFLEGAALAGAWVWLPLLVRFILLGQLALSALLLLVARCLRPRHFGSLYGLACQENARRPGQSLTLVSILAIGTFLTVAVGLNHLGPGSSGRGGGTGGFAEYWETTLPVSHDRLPPATAGLLPLRKKEGTPADCLNLNRVSDPQILGVDPRRLSERRAFSFTTRDASWEWLERTAANDEPIPAVADAAVIQWSLQKEIGDILTLQLPGGGSARLQLCAALQPSVFQGSVVISEDHFLRLFPQHSGYHVFLADADAASASALAEDFQPFALRREGCRQRLQRFADLQNNYLQIFFHLGLWGLLLAVAGSGAVLLRNLEESRPESRLLLALGYSPARLFRLRLLAGTRLLVTGIGCGAAAALVAILPVLPAQPVAIAVRLLLLLAVLLGGGITALALLIRRNLL